MEIITAMELLQVEAAWLQPFDVTDPFNDELRLEGYLCQKPDHRYGALALLTVGGEPAPQRILATPKLHYPFDRAGTFRFPAIERIHLYEKLDGTNVLSYRYHDAQGQAYTSFKLRLSPVLRNSRWGAFLDLWQEMLERHPALVTLAMANACNISFELYGARNTHLIAYADDLAVAALFGVRADGGVVPAHQLQLHDVPAAPLLGELTGSEDPVARYNAIRAEIEARNRPAEDEKISGSEGMIWYVTQPGGAVTLFKCKPESVEAIHWAAGINKAAVLATCWNLLETQDELRYETLEPLLLEEYTPEEIAAFRLHIDACIEQVNAALAYEAKVLAAYRTLGLSLLTHKAEVMRALAAQFPRQEMKRVYSTIARNEAK
jgi:hypothetical protein